MIVADASRIGFCRRCETHLPLYVEFHRFSSGAGFCRFLAQRGGLDWT